MLDNKNIHGADDLLRKLEAAKNYLLNDVQEVIGTEAVKHFKANFVNEGFDDNKWAARKTKVKLNKKILTGQGSGDHLSDSIDYKTEGNIITIYTDKVYAEIHNEGFDGQESVPEHERTRKGKKETVRAHSRHMVMPKREFMGPSDQLNQQITDKITRDLNRITGS